MTKNGRRALFLLAATAANMLLTVLIVAFLAGVVLSGIAYSRVLKALRKRPDLEERFGLIK